MKYRIALTTALLFLAGCATTAEMQPTQAYPASAGEVKLKKKDPNNKVKVQVNHLPPPNYIESNLTTYVVWIKPEGDPQWNNIGQIQIDEDDREGQLETTTPYENFDVRVTAESDKTAKSPSDHVMMGADVG